MHTDNRGMRKHRQRTVRKQEKQQKVGGRGEARTNGGREDEWRNTGVRKRRTKYMRKTSETNKILTECLKERKKKCLKRDQWKNTRNGLFLQGRDTHQKRKQSPQK